MKIEEIIEKFRDSYKGHSRNIETDDECSWTNIPGLIKQSQKENVKFIFALQPTTAYEPPHHDYTVVQYDLTT